jgi:integrator complex subunit 11
MPGTVGNKVLSGHKVVQIDGRDVPVNLQVYNMSFSAHADSKGIMELLTHLEPKNVFLVHGEKDKMKVLAENVRKNLGVPCYYPPNHSVTLIETCP